MMGKRLYRCPPTESANTHKRTRARFYAHRILFYNVLVIYYLQWLRCSSLFYDKEKSETHLLTVAHSTAKVTSPPPPRVYFTYILYIVPVLQRFSDFTPVGRSPLQPEEVIIPHLEYVFIKIFCFFNVCIFLYTFVHTNILKFCKAVKKTWSKL